MEKLLVLEFDEVTLGWNGKPSEISLRVSLQGTVKVIAVKNSAGFTVKSPFGEQQMHVLVQAGNIAMASVTYRLNALFANKEVFEKNFELTVPGNVVKILVPGVNASKMVRVKLNGKWDKGKEEKKTGKSNGKLKVRPIEDKKNEEVVSVEGLEEAKGVLTQDPEEKQPQSPVLLEKNSAPLEKTPEKSPSSRGKSPIPIEKTPSPKVNLSTPEPSRLIPFLHLSLPTSNCSYIQKIQQVSSYETEINKILDSLKFSMGATFSKFLQESIRRDGRTGIRKSTTSSTSPRKHDLSQMSFVSTRQDENNIDLPSKIEVLIEKLSIKNSSQLFCLIVALLGKVTYYESISEEAKILAEENCKQEEHLENIKKSLAESREEFEEACAGEKSLEDEVRLRVLEKKKNLVEIKGKRALVEHEKTLRKEKLEKVKEENKVVKAEADPGGKISAILHVKKEIEEVEHKRNQLENNFQEFSKKIHEEFNKITAEQIKTAEAKAGLLRETKAKHKESEDFSKENWVLSTQIAKLLKNSEISHEFFDLTEETSNSSSFFKESTEFLSESGFALRAENDQNSISLLSNISSLESHLNHDHSLSTSMQKSLESASSTLNSFSSDFKRTSEKSENYQKLINSYQTLENKFENLKYKQEHSKEIKDQVINELCYFSDFIFALSQTFLYQSRISFKIKAIVDETDFNVQAMRESLAFFKIKNPVYQPIKADAIDKALADYLNSRNSVLPLPFVREVYGIYLFGGRKVNISIERGKLTVKVGGGFLPIEEFIDSYTEIELEKFEKRHQDVTPRMKKLMAKWVGGLAGDPDRGNGNLRDTLVSAVRDQKYSTAYAVKEFSPKRNEIFEERPETPIIGDD